MKELLIKLKLLMLFSLPLLVQGQWVLINDGGGTPDASAALEIRSTDRGLLIPRMGITDRLAIASPAEGLLVYQNDSTKGYYLYQNSEWNILEGKTVINNVNNSKIAIVRDIKAASTDGGSFTSGSWQTRDLNDLRGDSSFISIDGSTTFTLDSGLYEIRASSPARNVNQHQIRLYNVTDATIDATGTAVQSASATPESLLISVIKITSQKTFRIEHRCNSTNSSSDGRGRGISWGENVYTQVRIQQL